MRWRRCWLGFVLGISCAAAAQETAPQAPEPARLAVVETDATRAAADTAREELKALQELGAKAEPAFVRSALNDTLDMLLEVPGREASQRIADALFAVGRAAEKVRDTNCVIRAFEPVLAFRTATLGPDAEGVHVVGATLGTSYWALGNYARSKELLGAALAWAKSHLPSGDPRLFDALSNYASALHYLDDDEGARVLMTQVVDGLLKTHDADDPEIQWAFANLGNILDALGDVEGAIANRERVHKIFSAARPADHVDVILARQNLALSLRKAGDPIAARALLESVLAWNEQHYPPGHAAIERTRQNLAVALIELGDADTARILLEGVVQRLSARGVPDDPLLLNAKSNLIWALAVLDRPEEALELARNVYEVRKAALGADSLSTLHAKGAVALRLGNLGRHAEAAKLLGEVVEALETHHAENAYSSLIAQYNLGSHLVACGRSEEGTRRLESALELSTKTLGTDHPQTLRIECGLAGAVDDRDLPRARRLLRDAGERLLPCIVSATAELSPREAELQASSLEDLIDLVFARMSDPRELALGFELVETARLAAWAGTRSTGILDRACAVNAQARALRDELRSKSALLAECALAGKREEYQRVALELRELEQALASCVSGLGALRPGAAAPQRIAARLPEGAIAVSFRRYELDVVEQGRGAVAFYAALVLRADGTVERVDLGPAAELERALERWRAAIGIDAVPADAEAQRAAGEALRGLVVDKLRGAARGAKRWIVAPDDVLHLVPLDALPLGAGVVGDELRIEVRTHLAELADERPLASSAEDLVALGGIEFDPPSAKTSERSPERTAVARPAGESEPKPAPVVVASERMPPHRSRFTPLAGSANEVAGVAELFSARAQAETRARVLTGSEATKAALAALAPRARWLHVATHGFFAPDSIASLGEAARGDDFEREVRGLSPRVLCGLALAGANAPEDMLDRTRGVMTAEELAYLELDGCELAVLSACDSGVGARRSGQSVASLQSALHAAGARSAITALWKVSDEETRALMLAFYEHLWVEHLPKGEALWRAKRELRSRRAPTRAWAAWVLTGSSE